MEDEEQYEWVSSGGCERCDAMDGLWFDNPPPRPHPNCNCTIQHRSGAQRYCDRSDARNFVNYSGPNHHGPFGRDDEFEMIYDYEIICWGGAETLSGEVVVSRTYGEYFDEGSPDFMDDAYDEALELVEEIALDECPVCGDHPSIA